MINEAILEKIRKRNYSKKIRYNQTKDILCSRQNIRNNIKRTRVNVLNLLTPKNYDENLIFNYADIQYIKRCEWWYLDNADIKYIIKSNPIKPHKLSDKQIKRALELIKNGERVSSVSKIYQVSYNYFYYYLNNSSKWKSVDYVK